MTPEQPESPPEGTTASSSPSEPDQLTRSRTQLQAERRAAQKKERKHRHRWRRRLIYTLTTLVVLGALGVGGIYWYTNYRFDQIKKVHAQHLVSTLAVGQQKPFNILIVGSDSRAFVSDNNRTQVNAFGNPGVQTGQRSDVTMVARVVPATKSVTIISIPRDLWVDIPGNDGGISGMNRINAAFDAGPDLLVRTIEQDLNIPINHYMAVNFPGFSGMVNAIGGITMDFPTEVKDAFTGLHVTTTGCQVVNGTTALQLVRARHLYYMNANGYWTYDGNSDFSRIQRQDAFFRAVLAKVGSIGLNPITINDFVSAAVTNFTIDDTLSKGDLINIANDFRGLPKNHLVTETLPTIGYTTAGGAAVLKTAQPYAQSMVAAFNQLGTAPPAVTPPASHKRGSTTTAPALRPAQVAVQVMNASTVAGIAHTTAVALSAQGFHVTQIGNASSALGTDQPSEIRYGTTGYAAALTLGSALSGPLRYVSDPTLSGDNVVLDIAGSSLTVHAPSPGGTTTTTSPSSSTTTTIPSDVVTNTQPEPWNPYPCTLGASTQAAPRTTSTLAGSTK